jgi:hypothetical protein
MKRIFLASILALAASQPPVHAQARKPTHVVAAEDDRFTLDGKPFTLPSGEMHSARIPARLDPILDGPVSEKPPVIRNNRQCRNSHPASAVSQVIPPHRIQTHRKAA